jgi:hypothetical protein
VRENRVLMSARHRTNLAEGAERTSPTWAALTLFNYSGGVSRDEGHTLRGNVVEFRGGVGTPIVNQTNPRDTTIADNDTTARPDWPALVRQRLGP